MDFLYLILRLLFCVLVVLAMTYVPWMKFKNFCNTRVKNKYANYFLKGCFGLLILLILFKLITLIV